jgi:predicted transcriptional regulator
MQYLLSEKEYADLIEDRDQRTRKGIQKLQEFCTKVANELPIKFWERDEATPWGCILTDEPGNHGYCDECPSQEICPHPSKRWSQ